MKKTARPTDAEVRARDTQVDAMVKKSTKTTVGPITRALRPRMKGSSTHSTISPRR
jgi:hypothetical protein